MFEKTKLHGFGTKIRHKVKHYYTFIFFVNNKKY